MMSESDTRQSIDDTNDASALLKRVFGYDEFRGQQLDVIKALTTKNDCLVLMPTGAGKSLCYQIPGIMQPGMGIVVSPLIALMHDQVAALQQCGVAARCLNSSLSATEQRSVQEELSEGRLDLLYVAPERLLQPRTITDLQSATINLIAIDEAHCVSQWGHDFRQDYLALDSLGELFPNVPRIALTATADERTRTEIVARLALKQPRTFVSGFDRPNISYAVQNKTDAKKQLLTFLKGRDHESGIVYCMSRAKVESTAQWLNDAGYRAYPYHAGLSAEMRNRHQHQFIQDDGVIIVATIAFGMGIDKPDVRFVAHLDLPKSVEAYYQETGRAGRDGDAAEAWMIYGLQDVVRLSQMVEQSESDEQHKRIERQKLDALLGWCEITDCRRGALLRYFGESPDGPCGNCDTCLTPPQTWDATLAAQQLLSCIYRTGQRFGAGHVLDVLIGKLTPKVEQYRHQDVTTFGLGADIDIKRWRSILRQLIARGFVTAPPEQYGALKLTSASKPLLRGEFTLMLREDVTAPTRRAKRRRETELAPENTVLWEALRNCRNRLAKAQAIPPYTVFHDSTLIEMATTRPNSLDAMLDISGVGPTKLERYGDAFLEVISSSGALDTS